MVYLDYSATTFPDKKVLNKFVNISENYNANSNSHYDIAYDSKNKIDESTIQIATYLKVLPEEVIYTSGASESNNMVIKGLASLTTRKHIITTPFEHSSILAPLGYLQSLGYKISFVKFLSDGTVDLKDLESLITDDTFLISIGAVNSELGFKQPIEKIGELLKKYDVIFHSDITQCLGKEEISLENVDLASFSAHKIYGIKGIGGLIKKKNIKITPLIHGGKSTTVFRSGTPQTELICSMSEAFALVIPQIKDNYLKVKKLNDKLVNGLKEYNDIKVNSSKKSIPHILNFSILNKKADDIQDYFAKRKIYFSTKTACGSDEDKSFAVYNYTKDNARAISSVRISLSFKTTDKEIDEFLKVLESFMVKNENN